MSESATARRSRRALISVYDKAGLLELATGLHAPASRSCPPAPPRQRIADAGVPVTPVEQLTGFPECLDGRVKTLHPARARRAPGRHRASPSTRPARRAGHRAVRAAGGRTSTRSRETVASGATPDECVEQIDIGGPAMVRAVGEEPRQRGRRRRPAAVRRGCWSRSRRAGSPWRTASALAADGVPAHRDLRRRRRVLDGQRAGAASRDGPAVPGLGRRPPGSAGPTLRYGENPHQAAALYSTGAGGLAAAEQLHGKEMSYNNYVDADAAWRAAHDHDGARASRSSSTPTRAASPSAPTSPRPTARRTPATRSARSAA